MFILKLNIHYTYVIDDLNGLSLFVGYDMIGALFQLFSFFPFLSHNFFYLNEKLGPLYLFWELE